LDGFDLVVVINQTLHERVFEQTIELTQRRRFHRHTGCRRNLRGFQHQRADRIDVDRLARLEFHTQGVLHGVLTFVRRQLQQLEVQLVRHLLRMLCQQLVIGHAKMRRGKHLLAILVVLERAGLTHQGINDVPIVDIGPARAHEPRHLLNEYALVRDGDFLRSDLDIHGPANQSAGDRVHVLSDRDRTALGDAQPFEPLVGIKPMVGQLLQGHLFLKKLGLTMQVGLSDWGRTDCATWRPAAQTSAGWSRETDRDTAP
jgi:hypothetical protein